MRAPEIVRLGEDQIDAGVGVLTRAFHTDPPFLYALPDPAERNLVMPPMMKAFVTYAHLFGVPLTTAGAPEAIALWLPLDDLRKTPEQDRRAGIDQVPRILGSEAYNRLMHIAALSEKFHYRCAPGRHLYLEFLGVEPARQGMGLGSELVRAMFERANAERVPCYLDTFNPRNVPLYKRHGFKVMMEEVEPNSGIRGWGFLRPPS